MHSNRSAAATRLLALAAALTMTSAIDAAAATPDPRFGDGGSVVTDFAGNADRAEDVEVDSAGRTIVAGSSRAERSAFAIARHRADGSLDRSFSGDGRLTVAFPGGSATGNALAVDANGRYVVAGTVYGAGDADTKVVLARVDRDGTLDGSFGRRGRVTIGSSRALSGRDVAIDESGRIVIAGTAGSPGNAEDMAVVRLNPGGEPDAGFGPRGLRVIDLGSDRDRAEAVAVSDDGDVIAAGTAEAGEGSAAALVRIGAGGALDEDFGADGNGKVVADLDRAGESVLALDLQPDGRIVAAGGGLGADAFIARFTQDGVLDPSFSGDGEVERRPSSTMAADYSDLAVAPDGRIVALGGTTGPRGDGANFLDRYSADGAPQTNGSAGQGATALALGLGGKVVTAGERDGDFFAARFSLTGASASSRG